jgi:hypothetical protein
MNRARISSMNPAVLLRAGRDLMLAVALAWALALPVAAVEKDGMPDLAQQEQTCLPTSTANLIVWFGLHGYPKLIAPGDSADDGYIHTIHGIMATTDARYETGTNDDAIVYGIHKYIQDAGYESDVEYRGVDMSLAKWPDENVKDPEEDTYKAFNPKNPPAFSQDWLYQNDEPNKGFILLIVYIKYNQAMNSFDPIIGGHAITLVNAEPNLILVHNPAHYPGQPGREVLTPTLLTGGTLNLPGYAAPVAGLLLLSGSSLFSGIDSEGLEYGQPVLLTGAVCVTMHPPNSPMLSTTMSGVGGGSVGTGVPNADPGAAPSDPSSGPAKPISAATSLVLWLFDLLLGK